MKAYNQSNLKAIYDSMELQHSFSILPPDTDTIICYIERLIHSRVHICALYTDVFCVSAATISSIISTLQQHLCSTVIVLKAFCYGHYINTAKQLPSDILCDLGHSLWNIGDNGAMIERLAKYLIFLSLENKKRNIILWLNSAHNLHEDNTDMLIMLVKKMNEEGINLFLVLVGDSTKLSEKISTCDFKKVGRGLPVIYKLTSIKDSLSLCKVLASYDTSLTKVFFPKAFEKGYRLINDVKIVLEAFKKVSKSVDTSFIGIPHDILIDTIYMCLYLKGLKGEKKYWPTLDDWVECIAYTSYQEFVQLKNSIGNVF